MQEFKNQQLFYNDVLDRISNSLLNIITPTKEINIVLPNVPTPEKDLIAVFFISETNEDITQDNADMLIQINSTGKIITTSNNYDEKTLNFYK